MKQKQIIALVSATALAVTALAGCGKTSEENTQKTAVGEAEGTAKEDLPFSKYAETVKVHLGGSMNPNAKIPDGMSYEDNSYTRLLKDDLNIEVVYDWIASSSDFEEKMNLCMWNMSQRRFAKSNNLMKQVHVDKLKRTSIPFLI
jgi:putative aldouronate transport system substrate-binding protein